MAPKMKGKGKEHCMPQSDYMAEHSRLIGLLNDISKKAKGEADTQAAEVQGGAKDKPKRAPSVWIQALREWNKGGIWCIPRKGSKDMEEVQAIMAKIRAGQKAPKGAPIEPAPTSKFTEKQKEEFTKKFKSMTKYYEENPEFWKKESMKTKNDYYGNIDIALSYFKILKGISEVPKFALRGYKNYCSTRECKSLFENAEPKNEIVAGPDISDFMKGKVKPAKPAKLDIPRFKKKTEYKTGDIVKHNGKIWSAIHKNSDTPPWPSWKELTEDEARKQMSA
jgi:hypothetical protein